jgi:predicted metalloenzyme YecM
MLNTIEDFYLDSEKYIKIFNEFIDKHSLINKSLPDHICYKCDSVESFESLRKILEKESKFIYQSIISERRIAYIKLKRGFETSLGTIYFLELADQKPDKSQINSFDHIEVYPTGLSYEDFVNDLAKTEKVIKVVRPHHTTDDIEIGGGFLFRCTEGPLLEKIKGSEML